MSEAYEQFVNKMHSEYPKMFAGRYGGFAVGEGWWPILEALCRNIDSHITWRRGQRARALVFNRRLRKAIKLNSTAPLLTSKTPTEWQIKDAESALIEQSFKEVPNKVNHIIVEQIKEKFGGLRFYYQGGDEQVYGMVRMAEEWASRTCEQCGAPGKLRGGGWVQTLCDTHEAERQARYKERFGDEV